MIEENGIAYKDIMKLLLKHQAPNVLVEEFRNAPYIQQAIKENIHAEIVAIRLFFSRILGLLPGLTLRPQYLVQVDTIYKDWIMGFDKEIIPFILTTYKTDMENT